MNRLLVGLVVFLLCSFLLPLYGVDNRDNDGVKDRPVLTEAQYVGDQVPVKRTETAIDKIKAESVQISDRADRTSFVRAKLQDLTATVKADETVTQDERYQRGLLERRLDAEKEKIMSEINRTWGNVTLGAASLEPDGHETDDSPGQASVILGGMWVADHNIYPAGDVDYYKFTITGIGEFVEIITKTENPYWASDGLIIGPAEADLDPFITLYDTDGTTVLATNDDGGAGWDAFVSYPLLGAGDYYLAIQASPNNPNVTVGSYELGLVFLRPDAGEPDNSMLTAKPIGNFETITDRTIVPLPGSPAHPDYYKFSVTKDYTTLKAAIVNTPGALNEFGSYLDKFPDSYMQNLDPMITLLDAGGGVIQVADNRREPYDPELGWLDAELITPTLMVGDYYLVVQHSPSGLGWGVGSYEITLMMVEPDDFEPDNDPAHANPIFAGDYVTGHTIIPHDWDVYCYEGKAGEFIEITVSTPNPCGRLDPIILLFNDSYNLLQPSWDQGIGLDCYILWGPLPYDGKYYFEIGPDMHIGYTQAEDVGRYTVELDIYKFPGGIYPWNPTNAMPIAFNNPITDEILPRIGTYDPPYINGGFLTTMPKWYKFYGYAGETIMAKATTPLQYRGLCPIWDNDWMDDLNPELWLVDENLSPLAYNENLNPGNLYDDAGFSITLPYDGDYYLVVQTDVIGPVQDPDPTGLLVQHSYGKYDVLISRSPRVTDFDSDINVGHAPLLVNFDDHCIVHEDRVSELFEWDAMYSMGVELLGRTPSYCYWDLGLHDVLKTASNLAGSVSELKEEFITVYGANGLTKLQLVSASPAHSKEPWDNAIDGDTYCWNGIATVMEDAAGAPWAIFEFCDQKVKTVNKIRIKTDGGVGMVNRWARSIKVMASLRDAPTEGGFVDILSAKVEGGNWMEFAIEPAINARYIKLVIDDGVDGWRQITEFEVYEETVLPDIGQSLLTATTPHLANSVDSATVEVTLVDASGAPLTGYGPCDIGFYTKECCQDIFGPIDFSRAAEGVYSAKCATWNPGSYQVIAVAKGAIILNDTPGDNSTPTKVNFFGSAGQKGDLIVVEGSPTAKGEGWSNAVDGDETGWDGTTTATGNPCYAIFKFANDMRMPINKIGLMTDNGFDDDAWEYRQVTSFEVLLSDDMVSWTKVLDQRVDDGAYHRYLITTAFAKYVKLVLKEPSWTSGGWRQIVEFEALFDSKDGFSSEGADVAELPNSYSVSNNYPNPFNPVTTIDYQLPEEGHVKIAVFNTLGQQVAVLVDGEKPAGSHKVTWNALEFPSGVYIYRIVAGEFTQTKRMILLK